MTAIRCYCQRAGPTDPVLGEIKFFDLVVEDIAARPRGLSAVEEAALIRDIQAGFNSANAFMTLLSVYKQTILTVAKRCQGWQARQYGYPVRDIEELEAQGELGFVHALHGFNPVHCQSFASCAVECIKESIGFLLLPGRAGHHGNLAN